MHPIIVGYDGSAASRNALAYASGLARNLRRPLLMVYVTVDPGHGGPLAGALAPVFDPELAERWLLDEYAEVADQPGIELHVRARRGNPARELAAACAEYAADALVIGRSPRFWRRFTGRTSAWLANRACCPVIVVPAFGPTAADAKSGPGTTWFPARTRGPRR